MIDVKDTLTWIVLVATALGGATAIATFVRIVLRGIVRTEVAPLATAIEETRERVDWHLGANGVEQDEAVLDDRYQPLRVLTLRTRRDVRDIQEQLKSGSRRMEHIEDVQADERRRMERIEELQAADRRRIEKVERSPQ